MNDGYLLSGLASDNSDSADVCLILEGTFPYVRGGVSSWVKQLIEGMPELTFAIIYLGAEEKSEEDRVYDLPANVSCLQTHVLLDSDIPSEKTSFVQSLSARWRHWLNLAGTEGSRADKHSLNRQLHEQLKSGIAASESSMTDGFAQLLCGKEKISWQELNTARGAWQQIRAQYSTAPEGLDFNHYFWTVRSMHAPLFKLAALAENAPAAKIYHSVSTGYAGFLGSLIVRQRHRPYIISEHGIYTKERELDLAQADWIPEDQDPFKVNLDDHMSYLRNLWIRFFNSLGRMSYSSAAQVFSLYEGNRQRQLQDGAEESQLQIISNGVDIARFKTSRREPQAPVPQVIGLIGRVVPIKDIKTFIRAMQIVNARMPSVEGWLYGPEDEDKEYTAECKSMVQSLGLSHVVKFKGFEDTATVLSQLGITVLSSVSEGQPLVVLESFAAGIPAVTTDVGSCRELILGCDTQDKALGSAGAVVPIADPDALAQASIDLLSCKATWQQSSQVAIARVERYYSDVDMIKRYRDIYAGQICADTVNDSTRASAVINKRAA